jgi:hypothetical protein
MTADINKEMHMRTIRRLALILAIAAVPVAGRAADEVITNYFAGYVFVPATSTNSGTTGLTVSNAYLCFPLSILSANVSTSQAATAAGDVRAVMYALNQEFYASRSLSTNKSASVIARAADYTTSGTNVLETVTHVLKTIRQLTAAALP